MVAVTAGDRLLRTVTERAWQAQVEQLATLYGWRYFHAWNSRHSPAGFPDLVLVRANPRSHWNAFDLIFAELKTETGQLTPAQTAWREDLRRVPGIKAQIWRPSDREAVRELLERGVECVTGSCFV